MAILQTTGVTGSLAISSSGLTSGSILLSVDGLAGRLFSIDDSLSGSLFSVNTIAGLPIIEAFSDNTVNIGKYNAEAIRVIDTGQSVALGSGSVMYVSSSGNVGIGTTLPSAKFVVNGGSVNITTYTNSETRIADGSIHLMKTVSGGIFESIRAMNMDTTAGTTVRFLAAATSDPFNNTNGGKVFIDAIRTSTNMDLAFSLNDVAGAAPVERVRFMGSGNVGIGTTNPSYLIDVYKTSNDAVIRSRTTGAGAYVLLDSATDGWYGINMLSGSTSRWFVGSYGTPDFTITRGIGSSEYVRVTTTGNVGIGTISPLSKLDVRNGYITSGTGTSTSGTIIISGYYSDGALTVLGTEHSSGGPVLGYAVTPSTSSVAAFLSSTSITIPRSAYTQDGGTHRWYIGALQTLAVGSVASLSEVMRINSSGNVGIGTTNPTSKLQVFAGNSAGISILSNNSSQYAYQYLGRTASELEFGVVGGGNQFFTGTVAGDAVIKQNSTGKIHLGYGSAAPSITIDSSNNVGIGTTNPLTKFVVSNGSGENIEFTSGNTTVNGGVIENINRSSATTRPDLNFFTSATSNGSIKFYTNGVNERMRVNFDGNVGIGTNNPVSKLHISGSGSTTITITDDALYTNTISNDNGIMTYTVDTGNAAASSAAHIFRRFNTEFVRIDNNGNVGIGTNNPVNRLDVAGNISASVITASLFSGSLSGSTFGTSSWANNALTASLLLGSVVSASYAATASILLGSIESASYALTASSVSTTSNAFIQGGNSFGTTALLGTNDAQSLIFETSGSERMRISGSGNVGIGTSTPSASLHVHTGSSAVTNRATCEISSDGSKRILFYTNAFSTTFNPIVGAGHSGIIFASASAGTAQSFFIAPWGALATSSGISISGSGNVGIGTNLPRTLLTIGSSFPSNPTTAASGIQFGSDTSANLYRISTGAIRTDGELRVGGTISSSAINSTGTSTFGNILVSNMSVNGNISPVMNISASGNISSSVFVGPHTGSTFGTSSWATNALTASIVLGSITSASFATTASVLTNMNISQFFNNSLYQYHRTDITSLSSSATNITQPLCTFDGNAITNGPTSGWYNYISSTHGNYLTSLIANLHRTSDWYVGYREGSIGTPTNPTWHRILHSGNYNDYAPSLTGLNASGTWSISISGNAASATNATSAINANTASSLVIANSYTITNLTASNISASGTGSFGIVGIGTNNPTGRLHVVQNNSGGVAAILLSSDESTIQGPSVNTQIRMGSNLVLNGSNITTLGTNNTTRITIDNAGNVGVNTTSPNGRLTIVGDGSQNNFSAVLRVSDTSTTGKWAGLGFPDVQSTTSSANNFYFIGRGGSYTDRIMSLHLPNAADYGSGAQPKLGIYSTGADLLFSVEASTGTSYFKGNVGIGTVSPAQKLEVNGNILLQNGNVIFAKDTGGTARTVLYGRFTDNATYLDGGTGGLYIRTNDSNTTAVFINQSGGVGINTTSPTGKLNVVETTATGSRIQLGTSAENALMNSGSTVDLLILNAPYGVNSATTSNIGAKWGIKFVGSLESNQINTVGKTSAIYAVSEDTLGYNRGTSLAFYTNQINDQPYAERMRIYHNGNVGIGTPNPNSKFEVLTSAVGLANQPNIIANFRGDTDGRSLIRIDNTSTNSGGAALQAGISFVAYSNVSSQPSANKHEAQILLGSTGAGGDLKIIAPIGMSFNVSASNVIMTGSGYTNYGTNAMTITSTGNVGIGTVSPTYKTEIYSGAKTSAFTGLAISNFNNYDGTPSSLVTSQLRFSILETGFDASQRTFAILQSGNELSGDSSNGFFTISTRQSAVVSEKVRVTSTGNVGIGTTSPTARLHVSGSTIITGSLNVSANITCLSLTETSTEAVKYNIIPLTSQLDNVLKLKPVSFNYKTNDKHSIGLIAEDVSKVYPEFTSDNNDSISYGKITSVLIQSIKELKTIIDNQQKQIENLIDKLK
jgi:hypothetical protein